MHFVRSLRRWRDPGEWIPLLFGLWRFSMALSHYPFSGYLFPPMLDILIVQVGTWIWIVGQGVAVWWVTRFLIRAIRTKAAALPREEIDPVRLACWITFLLSIWGLISQWMIRDIALARYPRISFVLYYFHEAPFFILLGLFSLFALRVAPKNPGLAIPKPSSSLLVVFGLASAVTALCALGSRYVMHGYDFAQDEWVETFQSKLFAAGRVLYKLPDAWRPFAKGVTPVFIAYVQNSNSWIMGNLPLFALIRAPFEAAHFGRLVNPVVAGLSIILIATIARKLWPEDAFAAPLAALFLASSTQFLVTAMTGYAMPANLFFNLLWLWVYLADRIWSRLLLPWIGALALGVHYPLAHALFAAPFLIRMAFSRKRVGWTAYTAAAYLAGIAGWWEWLGVFRHGSGRVSAWVFQVPGAFALLRQSMSLELLASWQSPLVVILVVIAFIRFRSLGETGRDLAVGIALTLGFYTLVLFDQGHGWGSRYSHGILGNIALLGVFGFQGLEETRRHTASVLLGASLAMTIFVQIPLRSIQAEKSIRPFAFAARYVHSLPERVVMIDPAIGWYAGDLIRNEPFSREAPLIVNSEHLTDAGRSRLHELFDGSIRTVTPEEIGRFGISILSPAK